MHAGSKAGPMRLGIDGVRVLVAVGVSSATYATSGAAQADEGAKSFGDPGTVVMSGSFSGSYSHDQSEQRDMTTKAVSTSAMVDVFVVPNVSVGVSGSFGYGKSTYPDLAGQDRNNRFYSGSGALRVGYYLPLGERVGLWPVVSAAINRTNFLGDDGGELDVRGRSVSAIAQIVFHVAPHWFLRVAPGLVAYSTSKGVGGGPGIGASAPFLGVGFGGYW